MSKSDWLTKICRECKKEFSCPKYRRGYFCSKECGAKGRKMRRVFYLEFKCTCCGKDCKKPKYDTDGSTKFCSIQCMANVRGQQMSGENHPKWAGGSNRTGITTICNRIKESIGKCEKCGSKEKIQTHHKIKVSERPELAKDPTNLEVLCVECHAKEHPEFQGMLLKKRFGSETICSTCNKSFYSPRYRKQIAKYCSRSCQMVVQKTGFFKNCQRCSAQYKTIPSKAQNSKFCTNKCKMLARYEK